MSIFNVMNKVCCPKVYNKWCIIHDVMMQILQIFLFVAQFFYSIHKNKFILLMKSLAFFVHIIHGLNLKFGASIESWVSLSFEKSSSCFTNVIMKLCFLFCQMFITKYAKIWLLQLNIHALCANHTIVSVVSISHSKVHFGRLSYF